MIIILYETSIYTYSSDGQKTLGGMVATFVGNRKVGICSSKKLPIGFFINDYDMSDKPITMSVIPPSHKSIACGQGEYQTNVFEEGEYEIDDLLYCSENGKITNNIKYRGNPIIGIVNFFGETDFPIYAEQKKYVVDFITCFSNLESIKFGPAK